MAYWHEKYDENVILKKSLIFLAAGFAAGVVLVPLLLWLKNIPLYLLSYLSGGLLGLTIALVVIMLLL